MENEFNFETFEWMGQTRYRCPECGFDGYAPIDVIKHWNSTHVESAPVIGAGPTLFDADGKEIDTRKIYVNGVPDIRPRSARREDDPTEF